MATSHSTDLVGNDNKAHQDHVPESAPFSWLDPHPIFVIILAGENEQPFGIHKDFLCAKSSYFRKYFADVEENAALEHIVRLPDTPVEVFAYAQCYLYTGELFSDQAQLPSYDILIRLWKVGFERGIDGLCDQVLDAMSDCRRVTGRIPATPLLVQVWRDAPEGSAIRKLLLSWAAEYMRSSESRTEFARSLPQEVLSELVVAITASPDPVAVPTPAPAAESRKNVHYLEADDDDADGAADVPPTAQPEKRQRHSDVLPNGHASHAEGPKASPAAAKKAATRTSLPHLKMQAGRRKSNGLRPTEEHVLTLNRPEDDILLGSVDQDALGPREAVNPGADGVPDYFDKIKNPMDLGTMKTKMDQGLYTNEEEFVSDMRQIFTNCYTYWSKKDAMWGACERLEKSFEEKYAQMNKWIAKMQGDEAA